VYKKGITAHFRSFLVPKEEKKRAISTEGVVESGFEKIRTFGL
jgi:hypothetical protein